MTDYFDLLGFEPRPWLDAEEVKSRFLELSTTAHPDRVHGGAEESARHANDQFAELNAAAACLRDPRERVRHLLKLEGLTESTSENISSDLMDLFSKIGQACRKADSLLASKPAAGSPMLQAQYFAATLDRSEEIENLQRSVTELRVKAETELKELSANWPAEKKLDRLKGLAHLLAITGKWEAQLKERFAALAMMDAID